jgi:uncharacterized protein (TIGR02147 family)
MMRGCSGKRHASAKVIGQACAALAASPRLRAAFTKKAKEKFRNPTTYPQQEIPYQLLAEDAFALISDWYHFAILELFNVEGFQARASWCAKALGISSTEAQMATDRMLRLGLLRTENNKLTRTNKLITNFAPGITSVAHKNLQRQILQMAIDAIDEAKPSEKDITCITMAIDTAKIPEARKRIAKFRRELCSYLEDGEQTRVYQLALQLYPVSKQIK